MSERKIRNTPSRLRLSPFKLVIVTTKLLKIRKRRKGYTKFVT